MDGLTLWISLMGVVMGTSYGWATNFEDVRKSSVPMSFVWGILHALFWPYFWGRLALRTSVARRKLKRELIRKRDDANLQLKAQDAHTAYLNALEMWDQDKRTFKPERVTLDKEHRLQHQEWQGELDRADRPHREKREREAALRAAQEERDEARKRLAEVRENPEWENRTDFQERGSVLFQIGAKAIPGELTKEEYEDLEYFLQWRRLEYGVRQSWGGHPFQ